MFSQLRFDTHILRLRLLDHHIYSYDPPAVDHTAEVNVRDVSYCKARPNICMPPRAPKLPVSLHMFYQITFLQLETYNVRESSLIIHEISYS